MKWNIKVTVIPILIGALGTVTKGLVQRLEDLEIRGARGVIVTVVGNEHGDTSSNPGRD